MPKIVLKNKSRNIEYETKSSETIHDVKNVIKETLGNDVADIKIVYNGKIVSDSVPLCHFRDGDVLDYIIKDDDIEMKSIENRVCVKVRNEKRYVDPSLIISQNGKLFMIVKREKKKSLQEVIKSYIKELRFDVIIKLAMLIAFIMSDNKELAYLFGGIMLMKGVNKMKLKLRMNGTGLVFVMKVVMSFFVSLFMLNSDEILDFKCVSV